MKKGWLYKIIVTTVVIVILALIILYSPISDYIGKAVGWTGDAVRGAAAKVAAFGVAAVLILIGVSVVSLPLLATTLIVAGLLMLAWNLWPLFSAKKDLGKS